LISHLAEWSSKAILVGVLAETVRWTITARDEDRQWCETGLVTFICLSIIVIIPVVFRLLDGTDRDQKRTTKLLRY